MSDLTKQTVAIVGASSGIGLAAAKAAAQHGADVVMLSRSAGKLEEARKNVSESARAIAVDMLDRESVDRAVVSIGTIDHLVLTAVGNEYDFFGRIAEVTPDQIERSLDKLRGFINFAHAAAPRMRERGSMTMLSGGGAMKPSSASSLPAAANGAIVSLARSLAVELAPVRVNIVMPGVVDTPLHSAERREAIKKWAESPGLPARRFGQPDDIAHAIVFLMTNPYMTGHTLVIDGGLLTT